MSASWTDSQNKLFEEALAIYDQDTPDRWQNVARAVGGGKSVEDVKRHFAELNQDVDSILAGDLRQFGGSRRGSGSTNGGSSRGRGRSSEEQRRYLRNQ